MSTPQISKPVAHLIEAKDIQRFDVFGPTIEYLTAPLKDEPCIMRGTVPPGVVVPLHAHDDPEIFLPVSGELEGLCESEEGFGWVAIRPGDTFHVPGWAKHAFRNRTKRPAVMTIVSTGKMGRFFQEIGSPVMPGQQAAPPTPEAIKHFLETSERYGYWNATPQENERVGITLPVA